MHRGLLNVGNNCYVNALLQSYVTSNEELNRFIREFDESALSSHPHNNAILAMVQLKKLFCKILATKEGEYVDPSPFLELFLTNRDQQDISDFNFQFLEMLQTSIELVHPEKLPSFNALFYGTKYQQEYLNAKAEVTSFCVGPGDFNLPVNGQINTVTAAIAQLSEQKTETKIYRLFYSFPPLLWIFLNRFEYQETKKISQKVETEFQIDEELDLSLLSLQNVEDFPSKLQYVTLMAQKKEQKRILEQFEGTFEFLREAHQRGTHDITAAHSIPDAGVVLNQYIELFKQHMIPELDTEPCTEELFSLHAILAHSGSSQVGHYLSYVQDKENQNIWWKCNDSSIRKLISFQEVQEECSGKHVGSSAYGLLYVKTKKPEKSTTVPEPICKLSKEITSVLSRKAEVVARLYNQKIHEKYRPIYVWSNASPESIVQRNYEHLLRLGKKPFAQIYLLSACIQDILPELPCILDLKKTGYDIESRKKVDFLLQVLFSLLQDDIDSLILLFPVSLDTVTQIQKIVAEIGNC